MTESKPLIRTSSAAVPGTCGELAQGKLDGVTFLVTCPVDMYSTATVELRNGDGVVAAPQASPKAGQAVELTMAYLGVADKNVSIRLDSRLPRGKGMASSTADVAAAIVATADVLGARLTPRDVAEIALQVEPSDGVMFPGIVLFDHREGKVMEALGVPPPMRVVVLDFGGTVNTVRFNGSDVRSMLKLSEPSLREAVDLIRHGIAESDTEMIGRGSTISARANQAILPKPRLESVIALASKVGAVGVNVAHSGTVVGMLFDDDVARVRSAAVRACEGLSGLKAVHCHRVIGGGVAVAGPRKVMSV